MGPRSPAAVQLWHWLFRPCEFYESCRDRYGDVFTCRFLGWPPMVVFSRPEHVRAIFAAPPAVVPASLSTERLRPFLGDSSIFTLRGEAHERERKRLQPAFGAERLATYGRWILEITRQALDEIPLGRRFSAHRVFQDISLQIILRAVFGLEGAERQARFGRALTRTIDAGVSPWLMIRGLQRDLGPLSPWRRLQRVRAASDALIDTELQRRRAAGEAGAGADVLSRLLVARDESGQTMSDAELRAELMALLVAGHETTGTALAWAVDLLLDAPDVAGRLREEAAGAWSDGPPSPERIAKLPYLEAVVKEVLRLRPSLPQVGRILGRPLTIGGHALPAGTLVIASLYLTHRRPELFEEPTRFRPERFLGHTPAAWEWYPFGGGVRRCIGAGLALYEMKLVLATLFAHADLRRATGARTRVVRRNITLAPSSGPPVVIVAKRAAARSL
jgi:cytochrome P450